MRMAIELGGHFGKSLNSTSLRISCVCILYNMELMKVTVCLFYIDDTGSSSGGMHYIIIDGVEEKYCNARLATSGV